MFFISLVILPSFSGEVFPNSYTIDDLPNIIWSKTINGAGSALSIQQTSDEGYISCGISSEDATLFKTDKNGSEEWIYHFGGEYKDGAVCVIECNDGGFLCTGYHGYTGRDLLKETFLIKTDKDGNVLWYKTFSGKYDGWNSYGKDLIELPDGFVVLSRKSNYETEEGGIWLIKTDKDGNEIWNKTCGKDSSDLGVSFLSTEDGGFVITGITYSFDMGGGDIWLLKADSEGNELWNKSYGGYSYDYGYEIIQTEDEGFVIVGRYTPVSEAWSDACIIKTDSSGNLEWMRHHGGTDLDDGGSIVQTDDGGYIVVGITHSFGLQDFTGWMFKTDGNGNKLWDKITYGWPCKVIRANDGNYVVSGAKGDAWLFKFQDFENNHPAKPTQVYDEKSFQLKVASIDPDGDMIRYGISWHKNGVVDEWTGYYDSGEEGTINCFGKDKPAYVIAEDEHGGQSEWVMAKSKGIPFNPFFQLLERLIERFPILKFLFQLID